MPQPGRVAAKRKQPGRRAAGPAKGVGSYSQSVVEGCTMRWLNLQPICSQQPIDMVCKLLILDQN